MNWLLGHAGERFRAFVTHDGVYNFESMYGSTDEVWFDEWVLKPGDSIPAKIEEGLEHSRVLVLCMSAHAFGSDWAQLEAGTFRFRDPLNQERRFIPLRLDDAPIRGSLAKFLYGNGRQH